VSELAANVEAAIRRAEALGGEAAAAAREVARSLLALHREGLRRLLALREKGPGNGRSPQPTAKDPLLAALFELHGLGPDEQLIPAHRLAASARPPSAGDHLRCGLCGDHLPEDHPHLAESGTARLLCGCLACAILFDGGDGRYRRIVPHARALAGPPIDDAEWQALGVPVALAFFRRRPAGDVLATFPGPAGNSEAPVTTAAWTSLCARHPELAALEPDVEALLVDRRSTPPRQLRVSIDHGYRLAGILRSSWRGWSGGPGVDQALTAFFAGLP
jgi:hypothetical protein